MMQLIGRLYVRHINKKRKRSGTLWEDRFKLSIVDAEDYLLSCMRYIELNPVRARMVRKPENYSWSSYRHNGRGEADHLITKHDVYNRLAATPRGCCSTYVRLFDAPLAAAAMETIRASIQSNWALGDEDFRKRISRKTGLAAGPQKRGGDRRSEKFKKMKAA